tara:strand:+ start:321 stop:578 length:258 start_codon:yes stop_codon:yes gene_type:complete
MKLKSLILTAVLSIAPSSLLVPETTYAHGGSKEVCWENNAYGRTVCKHTKYEKKGKNKDCHRHELQASYGWNKINNIMVTSCKKT